MSALSQGSEAVEVDLASESLRSLRRGLLRAGKFALFVAVCNSPADRKRYIELLKDSLPGARLHVVTLNPDTRDPLEETVRQIGGDAGGPVMLTGLESAAPSAADYRPVLQVLNLQRPKWPERIPRPVVLWVPDYLLTLLGSEAPDFLDWRSDTIFFPPLSEPSLIAMDSVSWAGGTDGRMVETDRRERIRELRSRIAAYDKSDDRVVQSACAEWMNELGNHYHLLGELEAAEEMYGKALEIAERLGHVEGVATAYGSIGVICATRGDLDGAEKMFRKSLEIDQRLGRSERLANQYSNLGSIYQSRGDLDEAEKMLRKALGTNKRLGRMEGMVTQYGNLGVIYRTRGDLDQAETMHRMALQISARLGRLEAMASQYGNLGLIHQKRGDLNQAETMLRKALEIEERLGHLEGMADAYGSLGVIYQTRGDSELAREFWTKARDLYSRIGVPHMVRQMEDWLSALPLETTPSP